MQTQEIPISSIKVIDRQRKDVGDVSRLATSIETLGLLQPIMLDKDNRLVFGERRLRAFQLLGRETIPAFYRESLTESELLQIEMAENLHRLDQPWQEQYIGISRIHRAKMQEAALTNREWSMRLSAELLDFSLGTISNACRIAEELETNKSSPLWSCEGPRDAIRILLERKESEALGILAKQVVTPSNPTDLLTTPSSSIVTKEAAKEKYLSNPLNPPEDFEAYWQEKTTQDSFVRKQVSLSNLLHTSCLDWMAANPSCIDHIITDPPYILDTNSFNREGGSGIIRTHTIEAEHSEEGSTALLQSFLPLAFSTLKPHGYMVLWMNIPAWGFCASLAEAAGFQVQQWPFYWVKTSPCLNGAAEYNFTKAVEAALVCRKPGSTLAEKASLNYVISGWDEFHSTLSHPFVKPYAVWQYLIEHICSYNSLILEPFAGHGSAVISALRLGHRVIACESNQDHYSHLVQNVKQYYLDINPNTLFV